jgi:hypothetical protein
MKQGTDCTSTDGLVALGAAPDLVPGTAPSYNTTDPTRRTAKVKLETPVDQATFLNHYADEQLKSWWNAVSPEKQEQMLALLAELHASPLSRLDQFTVGLHTNQPDGWTGPRLVFAIRNNLAANGRATRNTICVSLALNPAGIIVGVNLGLNPDDQRMTADANALSRILEEHHHHLQDTVDAVVQYRRVNRRACPQRFPRMPCDYE